MVGDLKDLRTGRALRLIVIEDDLLQCLDLEEVLDELGHRVVAVAQHVTGALRVIDRHGDGVDLVLLDLSLAGSEASPVIEALRAREIPYLAVTGLRMSDIRDLDRDCEVVQKPFSPETLRTGLIRAIAA